MSDNRILVFDNLSAFAAELKSKYARKSVVEELSAKVNALEVTGGQANVIEEIQVNGVKQTVTDKKVNLAIATKVSELQNDAKYQSDTEVQALITAAVEALKIGDYAKAADLTAAVERIGAIEADYLKAADKTELQGNIDAVSGKVTTLVGEDADKSVRTIANEELAKQLIPEGAQESMNELREIAAWIQSHPGDAAAMNEAIVALQNKVDTGDKTVSAYVTDAIAALSIGDYAKAADLTALAARVKAVEDDYLKAADKTELQNAINGVDAKFANYTNTTDMNAAIKAVDDKFASYSTTEQMNAAIKVVDDKFANYSTTTQMNSAIGAVDAKFANYTTTNDLAANYVKVAEVGTVTAAEITALLAD